MKNSLPLNALNTFALAAEALSFQQAAEQLHITPSAVSHQIRNLEQLLDYKLFERLDKRVRLTPEGEQLFLDVRGPLSQLQQASARAYKQPQANTLSLSVAPAFATRWLLPRLNDFHLKHPQISLSVIAATDLADFQTDPIDAAIRMGRGQWPETLSTRLFCCRMGAVCHPKLLRQNRGPFTPQQLLQQPLIHNSSTPGSWQQWFKAAHIKTGTLPGMAVPSAAQVLEAVALGGSIGLVDLNFLARELESGELAQAHPLVLEGEEGYYLTEPLPAKANDALESFRSWLLSQAETASTGL